MEGKNFNLYVGAQSFSYKKQFTESTLYFKEDGWLAILRFFWQHLNALKS